MPKLILSFLLLLMLSISTWGQSNFFIIGKLSNIKKDRKVWLIINDNQLDSTITVDGSFKFHGFIQESAFAKLIVSDSGKTEPFFTNTDKREFYLLNDTIFITGSSSIRSANIIGGRINEDYDNFLKVQSQVYTYGWNIREKSIGMPREHQDSLRTIYYENLEASYVKFAKEHNTSLVSIEALRKLLEARPKKLALVKSIYSDFLSENVKNSQIGMVFAESFKNKPNVQN